MVQQTQPINRLVGSSATFSFDLSSATDRWPLVVLFEVMRRHFASAVVNSILACNVFEVPFVRWKDSIVCFVTGQPLGYLSSWPLFALSQHI